MRPQLAAKDKARSGLGPTRRGEGMGKRLLDIAAEYEHWSGT